MNHLNFTRINLTTESGIRFHRIPIIKRQDLPKRGDDLARIGDGSVYITEIVQDICQLTNSATAINSDDTLTIWQIRTIGTDINEIESNEIYFIATKDE